MTKRSLLNAILLLLPLLILAHRTALSVISYWHDHVVCVCLSVSDAVHCG